MRQIFVLSIAAFSLLLLSACTSSSSQFAKEDVFEIDHEYVSAVEYIGQRKSVRIMWINMPTKRVAADSEIAD